MTLWFLDHDADPNAGIRMGITPLSKALFRVPLHIIRLLFDRGGPHSVNCGYSLHHAIHRETPGRLQVLDYLLTRGASSNINQLIYHDRQSLSEEENLILGCGTPLHEASRNEKLDVVKLFVFIEAGGCNAAMHHCLFYEISGQRNLTYIRDCQGANPIG